MRETANPAVRRVLHYAAAETVGGLLGQVALLAPRTGAHGWISEVMISPDASLDAYTSAMARAGVTARRLTVKGKLDLRGLIGFRRALREIRPDVLHVHLASPVESLPVLLAARRRNPSDRTSERGGSPRIVTTEHAPTHHPRSRPWSRTMKRLAQARVARVIALSARDAAYLVREFGVPETKIRTLRNGVELPASPPSRDEARRRLGVAPGSLMLAYAGEIVETKGLGDLVEALASPALAGAAGGTSGGGAVLFLAGEGGWEGEMRRRASVAGVLDRLRFLGYLRPPADLYAACDIFVLPSRGEAMPLALLEAMAAGRCVVATTVGGIPEAVRDGVEGVLVPPRNPQALASALARACGDAPERERMGSAARLRISGAFTVDAMVSATCRIYDEVFAAGDS